MFKHKSFLFPIITLIIWSLHGCNNNSPITYQNIHIEDVTWAYNISTSCATFGSTTESGESGLVSLPISDGDLVYILNTDGLELYYRYKIEDGERLAISFDTVNANTAYVNGSLAFFELTEKPSSWESFTELSSSEVNQLSTLEIANNLTTELLELIQTHESSLHGTGLLLEGNRGGGSLTELLSICRPEWLALVGMASLPQASQEAFLGDLKLLWISEDIQAISNMIDCSTNLEDLIITNWEPSSGELLSLSGLKNLQSVTLAECSFEDLSNIEFPPSLNRLHMVLCESLTDIDGIDQVSDLVSLSFSGSNNVDALEEVYNLKSLKWMSFPGNTTQGVFNSFLAHQESLEIIELNQCISVTDVTKLKNLENLKTLIFNAEEYDIQQLASLDQLRLIILNSALFEDAPEKISQLKAQLPQTEIVPGNGLCLGSGWLLLLLPLVLIAQMAFRREL